MLIRLALYAVAAFFTVWTLLVVMVTIKEVTVPKPDGNTDAIIVLGAQVKSDGSMSLQLQYRMELAVEEYFKHPQKIVVCGAQGSDEPDAEAHVMRQYLISQGVPAEDILQDDTSFNTRQNIANAKILLGDISNVLIVTSNYHLPRAVAIAEDAGFTVCGVGSPIKLIYWPKNHYREALAWVKYYMQKMGILSM